MLEPTNFTNCERAVAGTVSQRVAFSLRISSIIRKMWCSANLSNNTKTNASHQYPLIQLQTEAHFGGTGSYVRILRVNVTLSTLATEAQ